MRSGIALIAMVLAAQAPKLPPPYATPSASNGPRVVSRPENAGLKLPAGFRAGVYAEGLEMPRFMLLGPNGEVLVTESTPRGNVVALQGKTRKNLIGGLDHPYGMAFWKNYLYVAETTSVKRYIYDSKALTASKGEEVVPLRKFGGGHWTRSLLFDRQGGKFYLGVGSESNVSPGEHPMRAAISRFNPDGSGHEIFASGTRNPIDMCWYPGTDTLWAAVQERDALGDDLVPDYFTTVRQGGFYGWPYAYIGPHEDPRNKGQRPDLVKKTIIPDVLLGSHVAVLGALFYTGTQFPEEYRGGALLAFHGSWNRSKRVGYSVAFVPFRDKKPAGGPRDFLTGWMLAPDRKEVWGRPVGLLQMPDGSLLVSDDGGNKIWRVSYD
jgi:glucose/arabinose dehydrogenase